MKSVTLEYLKPIAAMIKLMPVKYPHVVLGAESEDATAEEIERGATEIARQPDPPRFSRCVTIGKAA